VTWLEVHRQGVGLPLLHRLDRAEYLDLGSCEIRFINFDARFEVTAEFEKVEGLDLASDRIADARDRARFVLRKILRRQTRMIPAPALPRLVGSSEGLRPQAPASIVTSNTATLPLRIRPPSSPARRAVRARRLRPCTKGSDIGDARHNPTVTIRRRRQRLGTQGPSDPQVSDVNGDGPVDGGSRSQVGSASTTTGDA
jgi:hypothetical protein